MTQKTIALDFGIIELYDNYVVSIVNEGETIDIKKIQNFFIEVNKHYTNKNFVLITHRQYSYAVDPCIYRHATLVENLSGLAVVSKKPFIKANANLERMFFKKPFNFFEELDDAVHWAQHILSKK